MSALADTGNFLMLNSMSALQQVDSSPAILQMLIRRDGAMT